jgi:peptidoglycan/LPS O-acetylase OafA/YrhL
LTRLRTVLVLLVVACAAAMLAGDLAQDLGLGPVTVPWTVPGLFVLLAVGITAATWQVRQYVQGKRPEVNLLGAARLAVGARSCTIAGAVLTGVYAGLAGLTLLVPHSPVTWERFWPAAAAAGTAGLLCAAGRLAESFCRLPPGPTGTETDDPPSQSA